MNQSVTRLDVTWKKTKQKKKGMEENKVKFPQVFHSLEFS